MDELQKLMDTPIQDKFLCRVRDLFIFSTFTGISYIDMYNLSTENVSKAARATFG